MGRDDGIGVRAGTSRGAVPEFAALLLVAAARARAGVQAFHYASRPYDFDRDFRTDAVLVCTEPVA